MSTDLNREQAVDALTGPLTSALAARSVELFRCGWCYVGPGEPCRSKTGRRATTHGARWWDARALADVLAPEVEAKLVEWERITLVRHDDT